MPANIFWYIYVFGVVFLQLSLRAAFLSFLRVLVSVLTGNPFLLLSSGCGQFGNPSPLSRLQRNKPSLAATSRATYSAAVDEVATVACRFEDHEIGVPLKRKMYPETRISGLSLGSFFGLFGCQTLLVLCPDSIYVFGVVCLSFSRFSLGVCFVCQILIPEFLRRSAANSWCHCLCTLIHFLSPVQGQGDCWIPRSLVIDPSTCTHRNVLESFPFGGLAFLCFVFILALFSRYFALYSRLCCMIAASS